MVPDSRDALAELLAGRDLVAVGGMHMHSNPMELVRELVRQKVPTPQLLTSPSGSLAADMLIGAGLVQEVITSYIGFEHLGLAPCFRRRAESGEIRVRDLSEGALTHALYAGASGIPFVSLPRGEELANVWRINHEDYREVTNPFTGAVEVAVRALRPGVSLIHAEAADDKGNVMFAGAFFTDRLMAMASRSVVVQVERISSREEVADRPPGTTLPGFLVDLVVVAPRGCLPTASMGSYPYDERALREYLKMAKTEDGFDDYLTSHVRTNAGAERCRI